MRNVETEKKALRTLADAGEKFTWDTAAGPLRDKRYGGPETPAWITFKTRTRNIVTAIFAGNSAPVELLNRGYGLAVTGNDKASFDTVRDALVAALRTGLEILEGEDGNLFLDLREASGTTRTIDMQKVFVVHGHDETLKVDVERFLYGVGLKPVVLHRQPDAGLTIIEKLEEHSDVGYAIVLLTPDDEAYPADDAALPDHERRKERRSRQNVVLELGYFVGFLGRGRVCCLHKGNVVLPSDMSGIVYKRADAGVEAVGLNLLRELRAVGYHVEV